MTYDQVTEKIVQFQNSSELFSQNDGFAVKKTDLTIKFT